MSDTFSKKPRLTKKLVHTRNLLSASDVNDWFHDSIVGGYKKVIIRQAAVRLNGYETFSIQRTMLQM